MMGTFWVICADEVLLGREGGWGVLVVVDEADDDAGVGGGLDDRRGEGREAELDEVGVASVDIDSASEETAGKIDGSG